jgi:hypothetical protein
MNKWIKVEEWLPMISPTKYNTQYNKVFVSDNVLVFHDMKTMAYLKFDGEYFTWLVANEGYEITNVTHWQYLPEDPVE